METRLSLTHQKHSDTLKKFVDETWKYFSKDLQQVITPKITVCIEIESKQNINTIKVTVFFKITILLRGYCINSTQKLS